MSVGTLTVSATPKPFPLWDAERRADPYPFYAELRRDRPVARARVPERGIVWVVSRYADVKACLKDHERMVNALGNDMDGTHDSYGTGNLVAQDQPRHSVLRAVVRPAFAAGEILALEVDNPDQEDDPVAATLLQFEDDDEQQRQQPPAVEG